MGYKAASGAIWATVDRFSHMALQFVINLILANLLLPSDFGAIGMLTIFMAVSQVLIDGGFGSALIQKKNPTQTDYTTIFYWNISLSVIIYLILYISSPWIAAFYNLPILQSVLRVIGITLIINGAVAIQQTRLRKMLAFRTIAITNLSAYVISGGISIYMAFNGGGVWSLVWNQLIYGMLMVIIFAIITRWHPSFCFSHRSMKELFGFGGYILAANILQEACKNFQGLIIGKKFSDTQMGYYSQAYKLDNITSYSIPQVIVRVMYPVYSSIQDDSRRLIEILSMNIRVISYLIFPLFGLLILVAEPLITGLYGDKWFSAVQYYRILCVGGFFVCMQNVNFYAVAAKGKSRTLFNWSWYKWSFLLAAILIGLNYGMDGIIWGMVLSNFNIYIVNALLVGKYVGLKFINQISLWIYICVIVIMCNIVSNSLHSLFDVNLFWCSLIYMVLYISFTFKTKNCKDTIYIFKKLLHKKG